MEPATFDAIKSTLSEMPVILDPDGIESYRSTTAPDVPADAFRDVASAGLNLSLGRQSIGLARDLFAQQVADQFSADLGDTEALRDRLASLLSLRCFDIGGKALDLLFETERHLSDTRIISDLRPVFAETASDVPQTSLLVHTLKIEYHEGDDHGQFFASLDMADLRKLRDVVERAMEKDATLRKALGGAGIQIIETQRHDPVVSTP